MQQVQGYYMQPTIHGERVVFVSEDDLWSVPAAGGVAHRLTALPGTVSLPRFSPDGHLLAFTGRDEGAPEAYVMGGDGGPARRLTYLGGMSATAGWTPDGKQVLVRSNIEEPFAQLQHLYAVSVRGGPPQRLPVGPAREIAYEPAGKGRVLGVNTGDPARWKRYRGGTAGQLWIDREGKGRFEALLKVTGNLAHPLWVGDRVWFISDHEGHGNLYSVLPSGQGLKRHTDHEDCYARHAQSDGTRIVYQAGADLWLYDPAQGHSARIEVRFLSPRKGRARRYVPAARFMEAADLHPQGHTLGLVARGAAFTMGLWEGAPARLDPGSGVRWRLLSWLSDGKRVAVVSDEGGEEHLVVAAADGSGTPRAIRGDIGRALHLVTSPAGVDRIAVTNHRQELLLVDVATGRRRSVDKSPFDRIHGVCFSPDGRYLAYGFQASRQSSQIRLFDTRSGKITEVTRPDFWDGEPSFDPDGRYLYFLSRRIFDPVYDTQYFDLGFPRGIQPCLVTLKADTPNPFDPAQRTPRPPHEKGLAQAPAAGSKKKGAATAVVIDLKGIQDRVLALPVPEGRYAKICGGRGRVFYSSLPIQGSLDSHWGPGGEPKAEQTLAYYDYAAEKGETLREGISDFSLSLDGKTLLLQIGRRLRALGAGIGPKEIPSGDDVGRANGWLSLDRARLLIEPGAEWEQMFDEAWRLQRDHFWDPAMSGVDWKAVHARYRPLVDRVGSRAEFSDLLWELQGELGTSHCYELGGDYRPDVGWKQGFLGADLAYDARRKAWVVTRVPKGDSWSDKASSPLAAPGIGVQAGDLLLSVDGQRVGAERTPQECLLSQGGRSVWIEVRRGASKPRRLAVRTLNSETALRYRDWVEANRERVHSATKGRVGYVHIPNMGPQGYSEFHRYYRNEVLKDGLIVDVRFNGGGHVSQLLLEKLLRKRTGYGHSRWMGTDTYPDLAPAGPMVAMTNEFAGSDGDMFSHAFKLYGLGPLIGKRTWGGVVGIWPRHALVDGTVTTQPEFAHYFLDVGWGIENYGTDPDIEVEITPQDHAKGRDPQLERALAEVQALVRDKGVEVPDFTARPMLGAPRLQTGTAPASGARRGRRKK